MASKNSPRRSSVQIGQNCPALISKALESIGCRPQNALPSTANGDVIDIPFSGGSSVNADKIVLACLGTLVQEACGASKGVVKRDDKGDLEIDATEVPIKTPFSDVVKHLQFSFDDLPDDNGVSAIAELTYSRILRRFAGNQITVITHFPKCLRPDNSDRSDLSVGNIVLLSLRVGGSSTSVVRVHVGNVDDVMGRMCSSDFVNSVLPKQWQNVTELSFQELQDLLGETEEEISDYWLNSNQSDRNRAYTSFLMTAVGSKIREYVAFLAKSNNIFRSNAKVADNGLSLCDDWASTCERLTTIDWIVDWNLGKFVDPSLQRLRQRLTDVSSVRSLHDEITELIDVQDLRTLRADALYDVFDRIDICDVSEATQERWANALSAYNRRLEPIEHRCAEKLKDFFAARGHLSPQAILAEFVRFNQLMKRGIIGKELCSERDSLLAKMSERLNTLTLEVEQRANGLETSEQMEEDRRMQTGRYMSATVNKMIWLRQVKEKIAQMLLMCRTMLGDLSRSKEFEEAATALQQQVEETEEESFQNWEYDVKANQRELTLNAQSTIMDMTTQGKLQVNYSERLVTLLREVRMFSALGYAVNREIVKISELGQKFYQSGVALKEIANTYNNMSEEIIKSTNPMLTHSIMTFEKTVGGGDSKITWRNTEETERFIERMRKTAGILVDDNRRVHRLHAEIGLLVQDLFKIDLLRSKDRWMSRIRQIREIVIGSHFPNTDAWTLHWDMQIYKALEHQYQMGLESLHEVMTEIRADVVFDPNTGRAALRPPMENLREQYYQRAKEFLTFPNRFTGVGNNTIFRRMPSFNERGILAVMQHAASLFKKIEKELKRFSPMLVIASCGLNGAPTLEAIVEAGLTEVQHWESNIRLLKSKGREIGSVESFIKIDCVTLSTAGIKGTIEEHLSKLAYALNSTLRRSTQKHLKDITEFLAKVEETMNAKLTKLDEIGKANMMHAKFMEERPAIEVEWHHFHSKNRLLQNITSTAGVDHKKEKTAWDRFVERLDSHEKEMEERMNEMKAAVDKVVKEWEKNMDRFQAQWTELKPKDKNSPNANSATTFIAERKTQFVQLKVEGEEIIQQCKYFQIDPPEMEIVAQLEEELEQYRVMWLISDEYTVALKELQAEPWIAFRSKMFRFEDFLKAWQERLKETASTPISLQIRTQMDDWTRILPMLKFVRGDGFTPAHWSDLFRIMHISREMTPDTILFGDIIAKSDYILRSEKEIKHLHSRAQGEAQIREALDDVRNWAADTKFHLVPHPDRKGVALITEWKEVMTSVNDNQALLFSMKDSPFYGPFSEDAGKWESKLGLIDELLHCMNSIQRKWVYLEPIFARGALPQEQERFNRMDKEYLAVMKTVEKDPKVIELSKYPEYRERLKNILEQLERCQKALNEFLEQKRDKFPRFYFVSDDDLLEILGQSKNVTVIQSHLKKLFMGIHNVKFDDNKKHIVQIRSLEGETVPLLTQVQIVDEVESWLSALDVEMKTTLQQHLRQAIEKLDVGAYASQILCTREQIHFTRATEEAFKQGEDGLKKHKANLQAQLKELTTFSASNTDLVMELKLKALIMDLIHSIEVADMLQKEKIHSETDWLWRKQLRFYLNREGKCDIKMVDASFRYSYEYQGNAPKLVHTPLTDRCYLTLTQGMHLGYGGNPYGPAGTGKTESVKALGNAMGRQVLVFNCDEGIDFKSMGRIFTGLVKCGAWGCFDEFNRLKVDQLSAVSQMIQVIQEALKNGDKSCHLLGRTIDVDSNAGIFVTLNPAGKHYGGRSELPDNLKQLFRSVAMSVPDNELIAETILYSEGFEHATVLAKKMVSIFALSKQLLSYQQHYDWGLRALKAVLRLGGSLVHQYLKEKLDKNITHSAEEVLAVESEMIIKSLRVNTLSKLTFDDAHLFNNLISDVFPGIDIREIQYQELRPAILESIGELKLQVVESQIAKILQLYEALNQRMGVVLVGPSGSGKSTLLKVLRRALQKLGTTIPQYVMNPKAMPRNQLLGHMDPDTREWFDGVLTEAAKKVVKEDAKVRSWIFCDGDIDPEWVESLNSVLDDNKLLTMPNGVRIQFGSNVNFVFETDTLRFASPATVSRMGMIFLSEEDVDPKIAVVSWLAEQPQEIQPKLSQWINDFFYQAITLISSTKSLVVETTRTGLVMSALSQLHGCTNKTQFAQGLIFGLGSYLPEKERVDFAKDILHMTNERAPDPKAPLDWCYDPSRNGAYSFQFEPSIDLRPQDLKNSPMIRTVDCQRNLSIMEAWTHPRGGDAAKGAAPTFRPFVLVGPEGCGKTMLLTNLFSQLPGVRVATVNCSAQTVAVHVIQKLKQMCQMFNTNQGKVLRPKEAERLILLLKDLNLPKPDPYGTVQLHSFLQQLILYQGFYDADLEWVSVERIQIVGSMNPPGSMGRFPVAPRFLAIVSVLTLSYPTKESLQQVYTDIVNILLQSPNMQQLSLNGKSAADVARAMTTIYENITKKFTVDIASHYIFNPRDLTNWALNLMNFNLNGTDIVALLEYEGRRVFSDRLMTPEDCTKVDKMIKDNLSTLGQSNVNVDDKGKDKAYVSWMDTAPAGKRKLCIVKADELKKSVDDSVKMYVRETDLSIQLIPEVLNWIARADRVLTQEFGNLLLVGRSGVCAQEIVRIVAFNAKVELMVLNITRDYNVKAFHLDIKAAIAKAGIEGQHTILLLEDHNFFRPAFLEMINSLLCAGEIPGLYAPEELDALLSPMKEDAISEGFTEGVNTYFVHRVRKFLHVAIIMDPTNPDYELRCRSNPALFTRCTVGWMGAWGSDSLKLVPRLMMRDVFKALDQRDDKKDFSLTTELVHLHKNSSERFAPQDFKSLCTMYEQIFKNKSASSGESRKRLQVGLNKLAEAEANVDSIKKEVTEKQEKMVISQKEADDALANIEKKMAEAREQKSQITKAKKDIDKEQSIVQAKKKDIEGKLSDVQPRVDAAKQAVSKIEPAHIGEIKSLKQPPPAVQDVLEGVMILLAGAKEADWKTIRTWLAGDCKGAILNFDVNTMSSQIRDRVEKHLKNKANSFNPDVINRASRAAAPMAMWLQANIEYSLVMQTIQPLTDELGEYTKNLAKGQERMQRYEDKLKKVERNVEELKKTFAEKTREAEKLKDKLEQAEKTLQNAEELLGKLVGEKSRWSEQVKNIDRDLQQMPRRALLASAFNTYLGHEPEDVRRRIMSEWKERLKIDDYTYFTFLRSESVMLQYKAEGLPGDELSMDNAVLIREQNRTALIVDPASQASEWLKNHFKAKNINVEVVNISDERLQTTLELSIRFGKTLLITDVDRIEPFLYPLLRKELRIEGTKKVIQIGDRRSIDYADGFQLFLITRSTDLRIPPDVVSYLTEISFTITTGGLEGQLLGMTIQHEQPELEQEKLKILKNEESLKLQLNELEESLLRDLANSQGSLLENLTLIESLNKIKTQANEITQALQKSKEVQLQLDEKRNVYRPLATNGSIMFFLIKNLKSLNHMYQFSLNMFMEVFNRTLEGMKNSSLATEEKIKELSKRLAQTIVATVSRALFKEHRTTFGLHLARALNSDGYTETEWSFFVDKAVVSDAKRAEARTPNWVPNECKTAFQTFAVLLPDVVQKMNVNESDVWYNWMRLAAPEESYPTFLNRASPFQRLLITKVLRNDRLIAAMNQWACELLHVASLSDNSTLLSIVPTTNNHEPILLITTPGADPSQELQGIAYETVGRERFHQLAMGGGQQEEALRLLKECSEKGDWLFLKNLHLVIPWVITLQKELALLKPHEDFRLWLTSEPHAEFPQILLSHSVKITFEAPPGIKQNLIRTYNFWDERFYDSKSPVQMQLLFILAWLHAIVQERRSYIPQGWAKFYEFSQADIKSAADIVIQQSQASVDWRSIRGVLLNAVYGGRMETDYDVRILNTYLEMNFNENMLNTAAKQLQLYKGVSMPKNNQRSGYVTLVGELADSDVPAMFSLPPNADRVVQITRVASVINDLQRFQETKEASKMSREEWAAMLTPLLNTWTELCSPHPDLLSAHGHGANKRDLKPIESFVHAELAASMAMVMKVDTTMADLRKVIEGTMLLSEERRTEAAAMITGEVPLRWDGAFAGPERIIPWLTLLVDKASSIRQWYESSNNGVLLKKPLSLANLFRPVTFLNAFRQETSHISKEPLVELVLSSTIGSAPSGAALSVAITGLLLQGATMESDGFLAEVHSADAAGFFPMPEVYLTWSTNKKNAASGSGGGGGKDGADDGYQHVVGVPIYANATKETLLTELKLRCRSKVDVNRFILAGISLMLEQ